VSPDSPLAIPRPEEDESWRPWLIESLRNCGVPESPIEKSGRAKLFFAFMGVAVGGAVLQLFTEQITQNAPPELAILIWLIYSAFAVLVFARLRNHLLRQQWQTRAKTAEEALEKAGSKRPVFYLRSFQLDERVDKPSFAERYLGIIPVANPEQRLTAALAKVGPVIAIGRPGEKIRALGAARFYVSEDLWHEKVADVVKVSQLVLWATGVTDGLKWEISHLIEKLPPEKLVLWAHPHLLRLSVAEREAEWTRFRESLGTIFPKPLPAVLGNARFVCFASDWEPVLIAPPWNNPWWAMQSFLDPLASATKVVKQIKLGQADLKKFAYIPKTQELEDCNLATVLGVSGPKIRWSRPAAFLIAGFAAFLVDIMLSPGAAADFPLVIADFVNRVGTAALILVAFRYLRGWIAATAAAAIAGGILDQLWSVIFVGSAYQFMPTYFIRGIVLNACFIAGIALAVQRFQPLGKALWAGAMGGDFAAYVVLIVFRLIRASEAITPVSLAQFLLADTVLVITFSVVARIGNAASRRAAIAQAG
jgi:hypothetical protein